jgi:hypothetical protein
MWRPLFIFCFISGTNEIIDDEYYSFLDMTPYSLVEVYQYSNLKTKSVPSLKKIYFVPDYTASHPKDSNIWLTAHILPNYFFNLN